jgi:hypothetical protein
MTATDRDGAKGAGKRQREMAAPTIGALSALMLDALSMLLRGPGAFSELDGEMSVLAAGEKGFFALCLTLMLAARAASVPVPSAMPP